MLLSNLQLLLLLPALNRLLQRTTQRDLLASLHARLRRWTLVYCDLTNDLLLTGRAGIRSGLQV